MSDQKPVPEHVTRPAEYYQVRVVGDGDHDYFIEDGQDGEYGDFKYDPASLDSAKAYAKYCGGWIVKVTEQTVYEPADDDGVKPFDPEGPEDDDDGSPNP